MEYPFADIRRLSNQAANLMRNARLARGDRIAVLLPQMPETAIAHVAIYKMGAIAVPLSSLFGVDALAYRLVDSGAKSVVTDLSGRRNFVPSDSVCRICAWSSRSTAYAPIPWTFTKAYCVRAPRSIQSTPSPKIPR